MNPDNPKTQLDQGETQFAPVVLSEQVTHTEVAPTLPEWLERLTPERRTLIETANALLLDKPITETDIDCTDTELGELVQERFQEALRTFYRTSGLADQIAGLRVSADIRDQRDDLDAEACNVIARASEGAHGWVDMLPALKRLDKDSGMNCTLGSAMLHCALEDLGFSDVHTVLRAGHHVVVRELPDRGAVLYDATSLSTKNNELVGYTQVMNANHTDRQAPMSERAGRSGFVLVLSSTERDTVGGFIENSAGGGFAQTLYVYDSAVIMDVAIALENLSEIKEDARQAEAGAEARVFDQDAYRQAGADYIKQNNAESLTDEDIIEIARSNRQPLEELLQAARRSFDGQGDAPNPFDYLTGDKIKPKTHLPPAPNPNQYRGSSERYQQAKELVERFPQLQQLDFTKTKEQFDLFDGYEAIAAR